MAGGEGPGRPGQGGGDGVSTLRQRRQRCIRDFVLQQKREKRELRAMDWISAEEAYRNAGAPPPDTLGRVSIYADGRRIAIGLLQSDGSIYWGQDKMVPPIVTVVGATE